LVSPGQLDQNRIAKSEFRVEGTVLTVQDRMAIRKVFQLAEVRFKPNDEAASVPELVRVLRELARSAGGEAPLPLRPTSAIADEIERLVGPEQLSAIKMRATEIVRDIADWKARASLAGERLTEWATLSRLAHQASDLPSVAEALTEISHVIGDRLLLEPTNPVPPLRTLIAAALRSEIIAVHARLQDAYAAAVAELNANETWKSTSNADQTRILEEVGLAAPRAISVGSDEALLYALDARSLAARAAEVDAVSARLQRAMEAAARLLEPEVQTVALERATLRTRDDVRAWVEKQQAVLLAAVAEGPVMIR